MRSARSIKCRFLLINWSCLRGISLNMCGFDLAFVKLSAQPAPTSQTPPIEKLPQ
jgi:hypothetical protein